MKIVVVSTETEHLLFNILESFLCEGQVLPLISGGSFYFPFRSYFMDQRAFGTLSKDENPGGARFQLAASAEPSWLHNTENISCLASASLHPSFMLYYSNQMRFIKLRFLFCSARSRLHSLENKYLNYESWSKPPNQLCHSKEPLHHLPQHHIKHPRPRSHVLLYLTRKTNYSHSYKLLFTMARLGPWSKAVQPSWSCLNT